MIGAGEFNPANLPEELNGTARVYATEALTNAREAQVAAQDLSSKGKLSPFYDQEARRLAQTNQQMAKILQEYDRVQGLDTAEAGQKRQATAAVYGIVKTSLESQLADLGGAQYAAGSELDLLRKMPDTSGLFENTYKDALDDETAFNEMRKGLATYMQENGIQSFSTVADLYAAIDAVAPTLSSSDTWKKVSSQNERIRDQAKQDFDRRFVGAQNTFVDLYSKQVVAADPVWSQYPDDLKVRAEEQFQTEVDNVSEFFNPQKWQGGVTRSPETGAIFTPQMSMIYNNTDEWASVVEMVGPEWAAEIEARAKAGLPVRFEDFDWN